MAAGRPAACLAWAMALVGLAWLAPARAQGLGAPASASGGMADGGMPASAYRSGVPQVLAPPPEALAPDTIPRFRRRHAAQGTPRLMLFWNRAVSDEVATPYARERTTTSGTAWVAQSQSGAALSEQADGWGGREVQVNRQGTASGQSVTVTRSQEALRREGDGRHAPIRGDDSRAFEAGFSNAFAEAGVRLVDRAMAIRGQSRDARLDAPNLQALEAQAMAAQADYVVEVLPEPDAGGLSFRVSVKAVRGARILVSFTSAGLPPPGPPNFVAVPGRGYQEMAPASSRSDRGRQLARETMEQLMAAWGSR